MPRLARAAAADTSPAAPREALFPEPVGFVNDFARVMDEPERARLEAFLDQVRQKTGVQFAVLVLKTTAPLDPMQYKTEVYQRWFHGNRTSLLLLVSLDEHRIAFETGYDLEGVLPDVLEGRIIREEMTPRFRAGDFAGGIAAAVLRTAGIIAKDRGATLEWNGRELRYDRVRRRGGGALLPALVVFIIVVVLISLAAGRTPASPRRRYRPSGWWWLGPGPWGGGSGGGGFGGGSSSFGGFSGGGGFGSGGGGGSGGW